MVQIPKSKLLDEGPIKSVGFRAPTNLWNQFKAEVYREGLEISDVLVTIIRLYLVDPEIRQKVMKALRGDPYGVSQA